MGGLKTSEDARRKSSIDIKIIMTIYITYLSLCGLSSQYIKKRYDKGTNIKKTCLCNIQIFFLS